MVNHFHQAHNQDYVKLSFMMGCSADNFSCLQTWQQRHSWIPNRMKGIGLQQLCNQGGHLGILKTTENIKGYFYWPGYKQDLQAWISSCQQCQRHNPPQPVPRAALGTIKTTSFEKRSWNIMGSLSTSSKEYQYILVVTYLLTQQVISSVCN